MTHWIAKQGSAGLLAPAIGKWIPLVRAGDGVLSGQQLGFIERAGQRLIVTAPEGQAQRVVEVLSSGGFVEFGQALLAVESGGSAKKSASTTGRHLPDGVEEVLAPMSGTLYHQASPGAPVFAPVGVPIPSQSTLALVEVMKSLNPVRTAVPGRIEKWLVKDGEPIQAGQVLAWFRGDTTSA